jgi:integrase
MATVFKRRKGKNEPYTVQYFDHRGKRRTKIGFTDKGLSEELGSKLETEARLRTTGMIDPTQDRIAGERTTLAVDQLPAFKESLSDNSPKYIKLTVNQVRRVIVGAELKTLSDIEPEPVQKFLRSLRKEERFGHRTYNQYLQAMGTFCNWCVATKRLIQNPLKGIEKLNTAVDVRHARRALTSDEMAKLVASARSSGISIQRFTGEQRARIYLLSYLTGLRRNELASLTPRSFDLTAKTPTLTVEAKSSKHRRKDVLPLHPELAAWLPKWLRGLQPGDKLFPNLARKKTYIMVRKDLERIGIAYETPDGIADFHAAGRHSHITELLRSGASLPEAKELARHTDIKMTMRYTHIGLKDQARAISAMPSPKLNQNSAARVAHADEAALHGRCIFGGSEGHSVSSTGNDDDVQKRQNPCRSKGFDADRRRLSKADKIGATGHH